MTNDVILRYRSDHTIAASVRDGAGIHDVYYSSADGWTCSADPDERCHHILAVIQVLEDHDA